MDSWKVLSWGPAGVNSTVLTHLFMNVGFRADLVIPERCLGYDGSSAILDFKRETLTDEASSDISVEVTFIGTSLRSEYGTAYRVPYLSNIIDLQLVYA